MVRAYQLSLQHCRCLEDQDLPLIPHVPPARNSEMALFSFWDDSVELLYG